jgi:glycosyltransferase involved in cell wall biosynthesis
MRVLVTVDPYIPVPPLGYGGIERIVDFLVRGLNARGHEVTLVAHPDSRTPAAALVPYGRPPHVGWGPRAAELAQLGAAIWRRRDVDVIHSFGRLAALLPVLPLRHLPKVQSYQRDIPWRSVARAASLAGPSIAFTGCARCVYAAKPAAGAGRWATIPNGVEAAKYRPTTTVAADAPLVFLGRIEPIKGTHHAIAIARGARRRLVIAGNRQATGPHARYFDDAIAPHIDGDRVSYVGEVDDERKNALLGSAAALLMPIEWDEPFGIVMAEALACGVPVIAFNRGSVPDIVRTGVNGFACASVEDAIAAVGRIGTLDRGAIRADCLARFDAPVIVGQYERLYDELRHAVAQAA